MNSAVQMALMIKAKKVFGAHDTFLSFPVLPRAYMKRELDFFSARDADDLRQSKRNLQEFSTLVNQIPVNEAWLPTEARFLWDVYEQVLVEGNFAESTRTPKEEAAYRRARAFLHVVGRDGTLEDSLPYKAYKEHKDAYLLAEQKYKADKLTGENAADPAEQKSWREVEEPAQRANLNDLLAKWITEGDKNKVEAAQVKVASLGARSPHLARSEWDSRFNKDIDAETGVSDASTFYPTFFSPSDALDDNAWRSFKLSAEEVKVLLSEAPEELRERFAADSAGWSGKSLIFEFSSAVVQRTWLTSEVFKARFWRFADPGRIISDGGTPAKGECPAYVTAVVFARRVKEEEERKEKEKRDGDKSKSLAHSGLSFRVVLSEPEDVPSVKVFEGFHFADALRDEGKLKTSPAEVLLKAQTEQASGAVNVSPEASEAKPATTPVTTDMLTTAVSAIMRSSVAKAAEASPIGDMEVSPRRLHNLRGLSFRRMSRLPLDQIEEPLFEPEPPPTAPTGLRAAAVSSTQIDLAWADISPDEDGFAVERSVDGVNFTPVALLGAGVTSWTDAGLAAGTSYSYRLRAFNGNGQSAYSNVAQTMTPTPGAAVQDDSIYILAFICKSLPKCPNPDPKLKW